MGPESCGQSEGEGRVAGEELEKAAAVARGEAEELHADGEADAGLDVRPHPRDPPCEGDRPVPLSLPFRPGPLLPFQISESATSPTARSLRHGGRGGSMR